MSKSDRIFHSTVVAGAVGGVAFFAALLLLRIPVTGDKLAEATLWAFLAYSVTWLVMYVAMPYFGDVEGDGDGHPTPDDNRYEFAQNGSGTVLERVGTGRNGSERVDLEWGRLNGESADEHATRLRGYRLAVETDESFIARLLAGDVNRTTIRRVIGGNAANTSALIESVAKGVFA